MAIRPVFLVKKDFCNDEFIDIKDFDFQWFPGFSKKQKQKSIKSLHESISNELNTAKILEISTKSTTELGIKLSAFNLTITHKNTKQQFTVESAFQSSKVFEKGGPYKDILNMSSRDAKKDERLKNSGKLKCFNFFNTKWELNPKTLFYDWLYINALWKHQDLVKEIIKYNAFTDIEFNPSKSVNCQANAAALFVSLYNRGLLEKALYSISDYINIVTSEDKRRENNSVDKHSCQQIIFEDF